MNPYNFALLLFAFSAFSLGLLIWLRRLDKLGLSFFIFLIFSSVWATLWSFLISENVSDTNALYISRFTHVIGGLAGITWFHFCLILVNQVEKYRRFIITCYILSFIFSSFAFTPWFVPQVVPLAGFRHYTQTGFILNIYMGLFFICVGLGFFELIKGIRNSMAEKKIQIIGFFVATLIGFTGGIGTLLPIYGVVFPQYNIFLLPFFPFLMAYFVIIKRVLDVEEIVQAFQKEKLATIGLLAASVNHEIRNPLYAARGILENFKEGIDKKSAAEVTDKTLSQINRALEVITKLNRFAKPINEARDKSQKAKIGEAIQNVLDLVSYEFELDKIKIINQIPVDLPLIQTDQRQLEEILFNLIVNACYAMKETGGALVIASERSEYGNLKIIIRDTGVGISSDQMKHLFEPFHTTKGEKGTGLGLYITKQLVERNGGKISVKSKEGRGTSFILEFSRNDSNSEIDFSTGKKMVQEN